MIRYIRTPWSVTLRPHLFEENFLTYMKLLGFGDVLKASPDDPTVSAADDAIVLRYLCSAITQTTISTHLAQQYEGCGRAAFQYMHKRFALPSLASEKPSHDGHGDLTCWTTKTSRP